MIFNCPRTCPIVSRASCKFASLTLALGSTRANSHTTTVEIEFKNHDALSVAVNKLGGRVIGHGTHALYETKHTGFAVQLPNWELPVIAGADSQLHYDTYNGAWGNESDIAKLTSAYAIETARHAAAAQGWVSQDQSDGSLLIYHPTGGTMTVNANGTVESAGFTGSACDAASAIESALGQTLERTNKNEYFAERVKVNRGA